MNITLQCNTDRNLLNNTMGFCAHWNDGIRRYHVWIGIIGRPVDKRVVIGDIIYSNDADLTARYAPPTRQLNMYATKNAAIKTEIERLATYDNLMDLYNEHRTTIDAFDAIRAEADRLNAVYNAIKLLDDTNLEDLNLMRCHAKSTKI
jgi:3-deoxy-D-arabino-heptulosonate 7-phosphate (DAHP) synthase class II